MKQREIVERRRIIEEEYFRNGKTIKQIEELYGLSDQLIRNDIKYLKGHGAVRSPNANKMARILSYISGCLDSNEKYFAIKYAKDHENGRYLSEDNRKQLKEFISETEDILIKEIISLIDENKTLEEISKLLKCPISYVTVINTRYKRKLEKERKANDDQNSKDDQNTNNNHDSNDNDDQLEL